jgi:MFS transporter, DHA2 family, multidrug resistance protein
VMYQGTLTSITSRLAHRGFSAADSAHRAIAQINGLVQRQASIFGFLDCFWLLGAVALVGPLLAIWIRKFNQGGGGAAH